MAYWDEHFEYDTPTSAYFTVYLCFNVAFHPLLHQIAAFHHNLS